MKHYVRTLLLLAVFFICPSPDSPGKTGHRIVGQIAESYLEKAKRGYSGYWVRESMAITSTWPDFIKRIWYTII